MLCLLNFIVSTYFKEITKLEQNVFYLNCNQSIYCLNTLTSWNLRFYCKIFLDVRICWCLFSVALFFKIFWKFYKSILPGISYRQICWKLVSMNMYLSNCWYLFVSGLDVFRLLKNLWILRYIFCINVCVWLCLYLYS